MGDDLFALIVIVVVVVLATVGVYTLNADVRHFNNVIRDCRTQGYVQDKTTRLICYVEPKKATNAP